MGILNINEDSFFSGSRYDNDSHLLKAAEKMIREGAAILDVGGQSTRPGSTLITAPAECARVVPAIAAIHKNFPEIFISVDTFYGMVAREAVAAGAAIINDISAGSMDETMLDVAASLNAPYILMHMQGTPQNMQQNPVYENVLQEVLDFFIDKLALLRKKGIKDIIVDPGLGFGKTTRHNFELLRNLRLFSMLDCPLLLGLSRKGMIYKTLNTDAEHALNGTTVLNTIGLVHGAGIIRVHDVQQAVEAIKLIREVYQPA